MGNRGGKKTSPQTVYASPVDTKENGVVSEGSRPGSRFEGSRPGSRFEGSRPGSRVFLPDLDEKEIRFDRFAFPFENVVFQGGGSLCLSYCGAVKVLEEARIWKNVKRLAGTGIGGLLAALFAADYSAKEIETFFVKDIIGKFEEATIGCCPTADLKRFFGLDTGRKLYQFVGSKLKHKNGDADITFAQLQKATGKELCIVTMNVSQMSIEYCHPKTTPDMPVRIAIGMTMAQPGQFQSIPVKTGKDTEFYLAGGPVCNFPIHCFDGWFLSQRPEDVFCRRLHPLEELTHLQDRSEAFSRFNQRTLGFYPYSECTRGPAQIIFEQRDGTQRPAPVPSKKHSNLAKKRIQHIDKMTDASEKYLDVMNAAEKLLKISLGYIVKMGVDSISRQELIACLDQDYNFGEKHILTLMGPKSSGNYEDLVDALPCQKDKQITYQDVYSFVERKRAVYKQLYMGLQRHNIADMRDFMYCLRETMQMNNERLTLQKCDVDRTVGINSYYLQAGDRILAKSDRYMLLMQGEHAVRRFLRGYISRKSPPLKDELRQSYSCSEVKYFIDDGDYMDHDDTVSEIIDVQGYSEPFYT